MNKTTCKGENCMAVDGVNHSKGCIKNHDAIYDKINSVPTCFDRATDNRNGGTFEY